MGIRADRHDRHDLDLVSEHIAHDVAENVRRHDDGRPRTLCGGTCSAADDAAVGATGSPDQPEADDDDGESAAPRKPHLFDPIVRTNIISATYTRYGRPSTPNENQSQTCPIPYAVLVKPTVAIRGLDVQYDGETALSDVEFELPVGRSLAVIGPNGSGKSTLLGALAGTIATHAGEIDIAGAAPALVLQSTDVDRSLPITVRDTVSLARYASLGLFRRFAAPDRAAVDRAMERLSIADLENRQLHELSGGQRQRVLVAQGLAQETQLLLLDEPVTGLDLVSRAVILDLIDEEVDAGRSVIVTTHDLGDARRCDHVLLLDTTPIAFGSPAEALTESHLKQTFGGRVMRVGNELFLDDPHHHH